MRAIVYESYGSPQDMRLAEVEEPVATGSEVLLRVHAASLNASDWEYLTGKPLYARINGLRRPRRQILGSDVAGVVVAVGPEVKALKPGDAVFGDILEHQGGFAQYVCAPESCFLPKPEGLSFVEASALPQGAAIAAQGLHLKGQVQPGQKVLINGAGGSCGCFAIQIARHLGAEVTGVDNDQKLELMRSLGAAHVLDYRRQDYTAQGERYDLILDLVGGHSIFDVRRALQPKGRYLLVGGPMRYIWQTLFWGSLFSLLSNQSLGILAAHPNVGLPQVLEWIAQGAVRPIIEHRFPLERVPEALALLGEGRVKGKIAIELVEA